MPKPKRGPKPTDTFSSSPSSRPSIPPPFSPAPSTLSSFLTTLTPNHIYITSLDTHPPPFKRRIFAIPLILNISLTLLLLYRLQYAIPTYLSLLLAVLGYDSPAKIDTKSMDAITLLTVLGGRMMMFAGDFVLVRFVGMWPWEFFVGMGGEAGPVRWRRAVGFRGCEIVVRRSRRWDGECFAKGKGDEGVKEEWLREGKEGRVFRERIAPAVDRNWVRAKTGYAMLDKSWDLYFGGMIRAHRLVDNGENKIEDFRTAVFVYSERLGWLVWEVWKEHDGGEGDEGTRKLQLIKDKLTVMGKENLFFRWIEIVQSETNQPGAFTQERQTKAVRKIRTEFEDRGVDFDAFWADVGGVENMPGMEIQG